MGCHTTALPIVLAEGPTCWPPRARTSLTTATGWGATLVSQKLWCARAPRLATVSSHYLLAPVRRRFCVPYCLLNWEKTTAEEVTTLGNAIRREDWNRCGGVHKCMTAGCLTQLPVYQRERCQWFNGSDAVQAAPLQNLATIRRCNVSLGTRGTDATGTSPADWRKVHKSELLPKS